MMLRSVVLTLALLPAVISGCSRNYSFDGEIVDGDGKPIAAASINVYPHEWKRKEFGSTDGISAEDGTFNADWGNAVGVKFFHMVVSKDGYREQIQLVKADAKKLRVVMERVQPPHHPEPRNAHEADAEPTSPSR